MRRVPQRPRPDWPRKVEELGFFWHTAEDLPYWDESVAWEFTLAEVETLERATNELHALCVAAVEEIMRRDLFPHLGLDEQARDLVLRSWEREPDDLSLYGRFDLAWNGHGAPRLLEYNADTPTSLLEAAVIQWFWLQETHPGCDQFNSLHERLLQRWRRLRENGVTSLHLAAMESEEDLGCLRYLGNLAAQAGIEVRGYLRMEEIGWDGQRFMDLRGHPIARLFKLYPWEWLLRDPFSRHLDRVHLLEPAWKMLLSNKAILPLLWELNPGHPNLLPASFAQPAGDFVAKPIRAREGANVTVRRRGSMDFNTSGPYAEETVIFQQYQPLACADGQHCVIGSWVVGEEAAGMGLREDASPVTGNFSRFVPHYIVEE